MGDKIIIQNVGGDVIAVGVKSKGPISINSKQIAKLSDVYAKSLQEFSESINKKLLEHKVSPQLTAPLQEDINKFINEVESIQADGKVSNKKKTTLKAKLAALAKGLVKVLPKAAEILAAFTPLAPFSELIGEGVEKVVESVQEG